jgi:hypothetical protein
VIATAREPHEVPVGLRSEPLIAHHISYLQKVEILPHSVLQKVEKLASVTLQKVESLVQ